LNWQPGTVLELIEQTARTKSIVFDVPGWSRHRAGQHVDVRLTAEDGYQAQRSYSIASAPEDRHIELTVERIDDGEVSPFLADELLPGDEIELRGPIGGYFAWEETPGTPVFLVGGGSGIVPLRAMLRHHRATASTVPPPVVASAATAPPTRPVAAVQAASAAPTGAFWLAGIVVGALLLLASLVLGDPVPAPVAAPRTRLDQVLRSRESGELLSVRSL